MSIQDNPPEQDPWAGVNGLVAGQAGPGGTRVRQRLSGRPAALDPVRETLS